MVKASKVSQDESLEKVIEEYLTNNPEIREALEVFHVSFQRYASILEANKPPKLTTGSTSNPP